MSTLVTLGFGPDASIAGVVTLGFTLGEAVELDLPLEAAFIALMLADAPIGAIVGTRIYPQSRPQGSTLPAITSTRISGGPLYADEGEIGLEFARIQVDCWALTYGTAKLLADAVTRHLSGFQGLHSGKVFQDISLDLERDLREGGGDAAQYPFRTGLDFMVWAER